MSKSEFINWLENNSNIGTYSVNRYSNAIDTISSELIEYDLDNINLYHITDTTIIDNILENPEFQQKNNKGKRMYSAALNHYKKFLEYGYEKMFQVELIKDEIEYEKNVRKNIPGDRVTNIVDRIHDKPSYRTINNRKIWNRNSRYAIDSVVNADYLCEYDSQHNHFVSKFSQRNYVEAHHLIPMKFQERFECSLDMFANIVSLCMVCHKKLHYGMFQDKKVILDKLFQERKERLISSGIDITVTELYYFYKD